MKRLLAFACMITCIFGLTACGSEAVLTEYEQEKADQALDLASEQIIPLVLEYTSEEHQAEMDQYTSEEIAQIMEEEHQLGATGYVFNAAVDSFETALDTIGSVTNIGEASAEIDDDQIIVHVQIEGEKKNAVAEVIFSNDMFLEMESAALNPTSTMSELMGRAALNTLIGMGTVFAVLILISLIIYCFAFIPRLQAKFSKKNKEEKSGNTGIDNAVAQIVEQEGISEAGDDLELAAVIAAAIAASEGAVSTDGFVVRSIRRVKRERRF